MGKCNKGDACEYTHKGVPNGPQTPTPKPKPGPKPGPKGGSKGDNAKPSGSPQVGDKDKAKSKETCKFFLEGRCQYGDKCRYKHPDAAAKAKPKGKPKPKEKAKAKPKPAPPGGPAVPVVPAAAACKATGTWYPPVPHCPPGHKVVTRRKLCDTGCPYDLISPSDLRPIDLEYIELAEVVTLQTANGPLAVNQVVSKQAPRLTSESRPYILQNTPDVLNIGHRCQEQGFAFYWPPFSPNPVIWTPESEGGECVVLTAEDNCPYLIQHEIVPVEEETGEYEVFPGSVIAPTLKTALGLPGPIARGAAKTLPDEEESGSLDPPGELESSSPSSGCEEAVTDPETVDSKIKDTPEEALTLRHLMTHTPKNSLCDCCSKANFQRRRKIKGWLAMGPQPKALGDQITSDLFICKHDSSSTDPSIIAEIGLGSEIYTSSNDLYDANSGMVMLDRATSWVQCFPQGSRSIEDVVRSYNQFTKPTDKIKQI